MIASTNVTYCTNKNCKSKCWRYKDNWKFNNNLNYWFMEQCKKTIEKGELNESNICI